MQNAQMEPTKTCARCCSWEDEMKSWENSNVCDVILANGHGEAKTAHLTEGLKINKTFNNI